MVRLLLAMSAVYVCTQPATSKSLMRTRVCDVGRALFMRVVRLFPPVGNLSARSARGAGERRASVL